MGGEKKTRPDLLLVENELMIALEIQSLIEDAGLARVHVAGNETDARAMLPTLSALAAAILDVNLSRGTTLGLAEELRARGIPFAFATGYDSSAAFLKKFPDIAVIPKPFDPNEMLAVVREMIGRGNGR